MKSSSSLIITKAKKFIMTSRIVWFVRSIAMLTVSTRIVVIIYIRPTMKPLNQNLNFHLCFNENFIILRAYTSSPATFICKNNAHINLQKIIEVVA